MEAWQDNRGDSEELKLESEVPSKWPRELSDFCQQLSHCLSQTLQTNQGGILFFITGSQQQARVTADVWFTVWSVLQRRTAKKRPYMQSHMRPLSDACVYANHAVTSVTFMTWEACRYSAYFIDSSLKSEWNAATTQRPSPLYDITVKTSLFHPVSSGLSAYIRPRALCDTSKYKSTHNKKCESAALPAVSHHVMLFFIGIKQV